MPQINLSELSMTALQALKRAIERELNRRRTEEVKDVRERIKALAARAGMTPEELSQLSGVKKAKGRLPVKYRHPAHPAHPAQGWSGRGPRPDWVKAALATGKALEDLQIRE